MSAVTPEKKRLFLAINLSVVSVRKIAEVVERMQREAQTAQLRVAWVPAPNVHVTLKFLGWANADVVDSVRDLVGEGTRTRKGFELVAHGVGAFPSVEAPRVLWVGVADPSGQLAKLAADVESWMEQLGFPRESRPFAAHATIGRVKSGGTAESVLAPARETEFGRSLVREVVLYESRMRSSGSEYVAVARMALDAPPYRAERQTREVDVEATDNEE